MPEIYFLQSNLNRLERAVEILPKVERAILDKIKPNLPFSLICLCNKLWTPDEAKIYLESMKRPVDFNFRWYNIIDQMKSFFPGHPPLKEIADLLSFIVGYFDNEGKYAKLFCRL